MYIRTKLTSCVECIIDMIYKVFSKYLSISLTDFLGKLCAYFKLAFIRLFQLFKPGYSMTVSVVTHDDN